jgi:hypothetical protein
MNRFAALVFASGWMLAQAADFYVAPDGNDSHDGSAGQPMATIPAARDAARKAGAGPHRIVVMPGEYFLNKTIELDARDNQLTIDAAAGKVILYGGRPITGWRRDGEKLWYAELPGVKEGDWDFRALVENGRLAERARMPESGTFLHRSKFDVAVLPAVAGYWARKPTQQELTTLEYDPKDLPADLDTRNAEVRVYHMWDESLVGVSASDAARHILTLSPQCVMPVGAFGIKKYVVFNTREGMTKPGEWYLDRTAGRLFYWPLPGEDMAKVKVVAPVLETIIRVAGNRQAPAEKITLRGFSMQATTTPLKPAGFGAGNYDGALHVEWARDCVFEKLEICNVGGLAMRATDLTRCQIRDNQMHHTGAAAIRATGSATEIAHNQIHHTGMYHPSAVGLLADHYLRGGDEQGLHIYRNEIHDTPYSGIIGAGGALIIEENLIYKVMREMQDGGAIYGNLKKSVLRGNIVRDVVKMGEGYGVSSFYLDEGAQDCVVEHNVSIGVEQPIKNHIARNTIVRDNVFVSEAGMTLAFPRSGGITFSGNTLFVPGKINILQPNAIVSWTGNIVYREGMDKNGQPQAFTIDDAMPPVSPPGRRTAPFQVERVAQPPKLDGEIAPDEWPDQRLSVDREKSRWSASGAPASARLGYDDRNLYVAVEVAMFDVAKLSKGSVWGEDDGMEIAIAGTGATYVIRGFANGAVRSVTDAGASVEAASRLGSQVKFAAKAFGTRTGGWRAEWAIPLEAIGMKASPGGKVAFNLTIFRAEDRELRMLEGTLGESWKVDQAATLQFK